MARTDAHKPIVLNKHLMKVEHVIFIENQPSFRRQSMVSAQYCAHNGENEERR